MKKLKLVLSISLLLLILFGFILIKNNKVNNIYENKNKVVKFVNKSISMNLEQTAGAGDYKTVSRSNWPTEGYKFNTELSRCENGSTLSWDDTRKVVVFSGSVTDKCYVYFDIYVPTLVEYITSLYSGIQGENAIYHHDNTLANGAKDNSYRYAGGDFKLTNAGKSTGASMIIGYNDSVTDALINFYCDGTRQGIGYACGSTKTYYYLIKGDTTEYQTYNLALDAAVAKGYLTRDNVKNFVCFGSEVVPCPIDNLYRIIGVIDGKVKLIKWDYAKTNLLGNDGDFSQELTIYLSGNQGESPSSISLYYWNYKATNSAINTWSTSLLNKINLNTNFINNIGSSWSNKIAVTTWKVGGNTYANISPIAMNIAYQNELINPVEDITYDAKVGLMYVSDYGYAASSNAWTLMGFNTDFTKSYAFVKEENWLYGGGFDWTITRCSDRPSRAFRISSFSRISDYDLGDFYGVRPTFNLDVSVTYKSGTGSINDPIILGD